METAERRPCLSPQVTRSWFVFWLRSELRSPPLCFSLACRGGEEGVAGGAASRAYRSQALPKRCYGVAELPRANHVTPSSSAAIFGRSSDPSSTSTTEASLCSVRRSSSSLHRQVVRPRRRRSDRRISIVVGSMLSSNLAAHLGGIVSRLPATGGGCTQGPDCFFSFCLRVFLANWKGLSSNSGFPVQKMLEDLLVKLYPPRVT
ncbi:hypothetical protein QYE76_003699 [Lolium multiflorum]|uniref:Uncharacterized protein n=1 Tax=Lolium multiflorum TaxID=4521 RepID=A0AAD8RR36_LOLMU|nr:hypothetical protein QYE76_003699 [Lolium multiflorum]